LPAEALAKAGLRAQGSELRAQCKRYLAKNTEKRVPLPGGVRGG